MTETLIEIKDGRAGNVASLLVLWGMVVCTCLAAHFSTLPWLVAGIFSGIWALGSLLPLRSLLAPKRRWMGFEGDALVWRSQRGSGPVVDHRLPLGSINSLRFGLPPDPVDGKVFGDLAFLLHDGTEERLPGDFFPLVYRERIEAGFRHRLPGVRIEEMAQRGRPQGTPQQTGPAAPLY